MSNNDRIDKTLTAVEDYYPRGYISLQGKYVCSSFVEDSVLAKYGKRSAAFRDEIHRQRTITNIKIFGLYAGALLTFSIFTYAIIMFSLAF